MTRDYFDTKSRYDYYLIIYSYMYAMERSRIMVEETAQIKRRSSTR